MQLFIGGACAGKRDIVRSRFPHACWCRLAPGTPLGIWRDQATPRSVLVVTGWLVWIDAALKTETDDDALRLVLVEELQTMREAERQDALEVVLILPEVGRGIVPMAPGQRRLRDLVGRLSQEVAAQAARVWYVRHGLVQGLEQLGSPVDSR